MKFSRRLLLKVNHTLVANFNVANKSVNVIRELKILAKIFEFTVFDRLNYLTHLRRMYYSILKDWIGPFQILLMFGGIFTFNLIIKRNFFEKTVENLVKRCVLRRLIRFCTVCRCPTKRTLGLYGLSIPPFRWNLFK